MGHKKILLVEDDEDIRESLGLALNWEGHEVKMATNGQEALEYLKALSPKDYPGLIVLDLMMPVMDGRTFLLYLERHHAEDIGKIPIVVASAKGSVSDVFDLPLALKKIKKPLDLNEFLDVVKTYCGDPHKESRLQ